MQVKEAVEKLFKVSVALNQGDNSLLALRLARCKAAHAARALGRHHHCVEGDTIPDFEGVR